MIIRLCRYLMWTALALMLVLAPISFVLTLRSLPAATSVDAAMVWAFCVAFMFSVIVNAVDNREAALDQRASDHRVRRYLVGLVEMLSARVDGDERREDFMTDYLDTIRLTQDEDELVTKLCSELRERATNSTSTS